jgi:hypothetical protein
LSASLTDAVFIVSSTCFTSFSHGTGSETAGAANTKTPKAEAIRSRVLMRRFRYDAKHDILKCPRGRILRPTWPVKHGRFAKDCARCPLSGDCLSKGRVNKAVVVGDDYPALLRARRRRERWSTQDRQLLPTASLSFFLLKSSGDLYECRLRFRISFGGGADRVTDRIVFGIPILIPVVLSKTNWNPLLSMFSSAWVTSPVCGRPRAPWKVRIASRVRSPISPSSGPGEYPVQIRDSCNLIRVEGGHWE